MIAIIGKYDPLLYMIKRRKLKWYGNISRPDGFSKTIMQGIVEDSRKQGRPKSQSFKNISDWTKMDTKLLHKVHDRDGWRKCVKAEMTELIPPTISESRY